MLGTARGMPPQTRGVMFESMKLFECPYCNKQAIGPFGLLIFFTPLNFFKDCRYCQKDIKLNYLLILFMIGLPVFALYFLYLWFGLYAVPLIIVYLAAFSILPRKFDLRLFKRNEAWGTIEK